MRPQTIATLRQAGVGLGELAYRRHVLVTATTARNDDLANVLEFTMPLRLVKGTSGLDRLHLSRFLQVASRFWLLSEASRW